MPPLPKNWRIRGIILVTCAGLSATGSMPIRFPRSRAVRMRSRPCAKCFHQVDNHSCVRNTQLEVLDSRSAFHWSCWATNSSIVSMVCSFILVLRFGSAARNPSPHSLHRRRQSEFQMAQYARPQSVSEKKQPSVFTGFLSPLELPIVIPAKQVVFLDSPGAGIFHNQVQQHVPRRIAVILRVITNLHSAQLVPVL